MQIRCSSCGKTLQVGDQLAGKKVKCPCGTILPVPAVAAATATKVPAATTAAPRPQAQPRPAMPSPKTSPAETMSGLSHSEMSSLFGELTESDMIVKGPTTEVKKKKTKDPLAAYGPAPPTKSSSRSSASYMSASGTLNIASQNRRFVTLIIDNLCIVVLQFSFGIASGIVIAVMSSNPDETLKSLIIYIQIMSLFCFLPYYIVLEATTGRTLGKLVAGTRVVRENGTHPSFGQILGRTAARMIPFEAFSFLTRTPVGWHDKLSGTRVISK